MAKACDVPPDVSGDDVVRHFVQMAETFRSRKPPKHKLAIKCLMAARKVACDRSLSAYVDLNLGKTLWFYTKNVKTALTHLEAAEINDQLAAVQAACLIGEIYLSERKPGSIKKLLVKEVEASKSFPFQHAKLLFLLASHLLQEVYIRLGDYEKALEVVHVGVVYFKNVNNLTIVCYFLLVKCLIYSIQHGLCQQELGQSVGELGELLNGMPGDLPEMEDIRAFCYSIQLCFFLAAGFNCLRQLHLTVQQASKREPILRPHFRWLNSEMLTAIAYALTVLTNIHFNNMDRANRYFATSTKHFDTLKQCWSRAQWPLIERPHEEMARRLEVLVYEAIAPSYLICGRPDDCITVVSQMMECMKQNHFLFKDFSAQAHCILGMYACHQQEYEKAEAQYTIAAQVQETPDVDLKLFSYLSMGLVFLGTGKTYKFYEMFDKITALQANPKTLRALLCVVNAFNTFVHSKVDDCKGHIAQSLNISKDEDMGRVQALSSLLSSTLFKARDADAFNAGFSWAEKLGDLSLKLWGLSQMAEHCKLNGDQQNLSEVSKQIALTKSTLSEHREKAKSVPANSLLDWVSSTPD